MIKVSKRKRKQKLTENQAEFNRLRKQARQNVTRLENKGYYIPEAEEIRDPKKPKRITKKYLAHLKTEVQAKAIRARAYKVDAETGETITADEDIKRRRELKKRKQAETDKIIENAQEIIEMSDARFDNVRNALLDTIAQSIAEQGKEQTAQNLQELAEQDFFGEMVNEKYAAADKYITNQMGIDVNGLSQEQLRYYRYIVLSKHDKGEINIYA